MRAAGRLAAEVLERAGEMVRPGITTDDIDKAVHKWTIEAGAYPSPLSYGVRLSPSTRCRQLCGVRGA